MAAALVVAGSATATTPPNGGGLVTVDSSCGPLTLSNGYTFYVNGVKYQVKSWTYTTAPGTPTKTLGTKNGLTAGSIECSGTITDQKGTPSGFDAIGVS
jgi:hypothetical protein